MKSKFLLSLFILTILTACQSLPDSRGAAEDFAWETAYYLEDQSEKVLALAELDREGIPDSLYSLFRDDLSIALVTAFRDEGADIRVVTRDRVDRILKEQTLELEGMTYREAQMQVGRLLGADLLVAGTLAWLEGDIYRFSGQVIEVESGTVLSGYSGDFWFDTDSAD